MIQTAWAELVVATLADAGVTTCVVSPGSRSTPLVAALAGEPRIATPVVIDERAAAFCALGAARASAGPPRVTDPPGPASPPGLVALVCTSGTAAAHWLPALIEASAAGVPLVAITADRPPELQRCGAPQTIDQVELFGSFVRAYVDLGPPDGSALAFRAVRRKIAQAVSVARGPHPGPVHVEVPLRKPLEPVRTSDLGPRASARDDDPFAIVRALRAAPLVVAPPPRLIADDVAISMLARALAAARRPLLIAGPAALSDADAHAVLELARRAGVVVLAETGSQLRLRPKPEGLVSVDAFDPILAAGARDLAPDLVLQLGAEPVAASWPGARDRWRAAPRWVLTAHDWIDPDSSAAGVVAGELADTASRLAAALPASIDRAAWHAAWRDAAAAARAALDAAVDAAPDGEAAVVRAVLAAVPDGGALLVGNSLPIRVVDHVATAASRAACVLTQRGACGIDGLIAGAAGATWTGRPVVAIVGDVSFAHDLGGLAAAVRVATAPLAVVVIDNGGGRIFDGLPVATALAPPALASFFHTPSGLDPAAVAVALGARAIAAATPAAAAAAVAAATSTPGVTVIHAPVAADGAHRVRRAAIAQLTTPQPATLGVRP